jgi:hypothetical protein
MWQIDCENFRRVGSFELRDVSKAEHLAFAEAFAAQHRLSMKHNGEAVLFVVPSEVLH